jgi:hypothetical protein
MPLHTISLGFSLHLSKYLALDHIMKLWVGRLLLNCLVRRIDDESADLPVSPKKSLGKL